MLKFIMVCICSILLISSVNALMITGGIKYDGTLNPDSTDELLTMFSTSGNEISVNISSVDITGDKECKNFISSNITEFMVKKPVYVKTTIHIPKDTRIGIYNCNEAFLTKTVNNLQSGIGINFKINVTNTIQVIEKPTYVITPVETKNVTVTESKVPPTVPAILFIGIGLLVLVVGGIIFWKYQKSKNDDGWELC